MEVKLWLLVGVWGLLCSSGWCVPTLPPAVIEELESVSSHVIISSSPCSATCGLGLRTEELCLLGKDGSRQDCQVRRVKCLVTWQCGLRTLTAAGSRLELDCLGEVMEAMGRFRFFLSWRYARGVVTTDDSLFARWDAPGLDLVTIESLWEKNAGTYRCDVQDSSYRMVKRVYFGVRVLSPEVLRLDFASALAEWDVPEQNGTTDEASVPLYPSGTQRDVILYSLAVSAVVAVLILTTLYCIFHERKATLQNPSSTSALTP